MVNWRFDLCVALGLMFYPFREGQSLRAAPKGRKRRHARIATVSDQSARRARRVFNCLP